MNTESVELQTADLMTAISNNLNKRFFNAPKNKAKQQYQALESGEEIPFMDISVQGQDDISCRLGLDHSQFVGGLSFTRFRDALASHLERVGVQSTRQNLSRLLALGIPGPSQSRDRIQEYYNIRPVLDHSLGLF